MNARIPTKDPGVLFGNSFNIVPQFYELRLVKKIIF
jgi:hypothetical protein